MSSFRKLSESELSDLLESPKKGSKGHLITFCPFCNDKERKFYINTLKDGQLWDCKKCGEKGGIFKLLKHLGKLNLILEEREVLLLEKLPTFNKLKENKIEIQKEVALPIGFTRVYDDEYLNSRGFDVDDYSKYPVGKAIDISFLNFAIFPVYENGKIFGFLGRNKLSKSTIDETNKKIKEQKLQQPYILRWKNSTSDFAKLIYGIDELDGSCDTVVIVESIFGKVNVDRFLRNEKIDLLKCVATFGSKISEYQIEKLILCGIKNVILLFDADAINKTKNYSYLLECFFDSVEVGVIRDGEDIDDFDTNKFYSVFDKTVSSFTYFNSFINLKFK